MRRTISIPGLLGACLLAALALGPACKRSPEPDPRWAALGLPLLAELAVERAFEESLTLRFDPRKASEAETLERLTRELAGAGWTRVHFDERRPSASFVRPDRQDVVEAYTGHGVLELRFGKLMDHHRVALAAAGKTTEQKRAELVQLATELRAAAARLNEARALEGKKCPDARLRELQPAELMSYPPVYVPPAAGDPRLLGLIGATVGAEAIPDPAGYAARSPRDIDALWIQLQRSLRSGIALFVWPRVGTEAEVEDETSFRGGHLWASFVVSERASGAPLCTGTFGAGSSEVVWARVKDRARAETDVGADLSRNASEGLDRALSRLSAVLRFQPR
jgi:hypothetical protein